MVAAHRSKGPTVVLDSGDALFPDYRLPPTDAQKAQARTLLEGMARIGTAAVAVGDRDLAAGVDWLVRESAEAGVPFLAANLQTADGKKPFGASTLVEAGGTKVGVIGVWSSGKLPSGLQATDPLAAAKEEAGKLRAKGATVVVALVHGRQSEADDIAAVVDFVAPSHEGAASLPFQPHGSAGWLDSASQKGQTVLRLSVHPEGEGAFADAGAAKRLESEREYFKARLAESERSLATAEPARRKTLERMVESQQKRLQGIEAQIAALPAASGRRFLSTSVGLGEDIPDEPSLGELVRSFEQAKAAAAPQQAPRPKG